MAKLCFLFMIVLLAGPASAEVILQTNTTWAADNSPLALSEDTRVALGIRLTIEAGVRITLAEGVSLIIEGELIARGSQAQPIIFEGNADAAGPARWNSLIFENTTVDAEFELVDDYLSGSILEHCSFTDAVRAVVIRRASPYLHRCTFQDNLYEYDTDAQGGAAIQISGGSSPRIRDCIFRNNVCTSAGEGGAVHVELAEPILQDNIFTGNQSGYGGALTAYNYHGPIVGNTFDGNNSAFEGGATAWVSSTPAFLNNTVVNNRTFMDGGGVHVCVTCYPHANPFVMDNVITDNISDIEGGAGVGAAYIRTCSHNDIHDNLTAGQPADFAWFNHNEAGYLDWINQPDISNNWWGTTSRREIEESIHDGNDDPAYGQVSFQPVAEGPIAEARTRVTVTSLKLRYAEAGEAMPVYLTLYNPGPAREVELMLLVQAGQNPPMPYQGELDFPGAQREHLIYRLSLPENSVYFTILIQPEFTQPAELEQGAWHAALYDAQSSEPIGQTITIRAAYGEGPH